MRQLSLKMISRHSVVKSSLSIINFKIDKFDVFLVISFITVIQTYLEMFPPYN